MPRTSRKKVPTKSEASKHASDGHGVRTDTPLDEQEVMDYAAIIGDRLGMYVTLLNIPDEAKEVLMKIMDAMSVAQLIEMHDILEAEFINQRAGAYDTFFARDLVSAFEQTEQKKGHLLHHAAEQLNAIADQLQQKSVRAQLA